MLNHKTLAASFKYASKGVYYAFKYNQNIRIHFLVAILVIIASVFFRVNAFEMGILAIMILVVICTEMVNTAIEEMANLITTEHRKEVEIAKDVGAGMVLLAIVGSVIVGMLVFTPYIIKLLR